MISVCSSRIFNQAALNDYTACLHSGYVIFFGLYAITSAFVEYP